MLWYPKSKVEETDRSPYAFLTAPATVSSYEMNTIDGHTTLARQLKWNRWTDELRQAADRSP